MEPRNRKRSIAVVVSILGSLLLGEVVLHALGIPAKPLPVRLIGPRIFELDDDVFWILKPRIEGIFVNRLRLRGWVPDGDKGQRDLTIACVGDSCTFGFGVDYEQTYGIQLEAILRKALPNARVEVLLGGLTAYTTYQSRVLHEKRIKPFRPDITILYLGTWNDYMGAVSGSDSQFAKDSKARRESILHASRILRLIRRVANHEEPDMDAFARGEFRNGVRVPLDEFKDNLSRMIAMGRENGGTVIAVIPPLPASTLSHVPLAPEYQAALRQVYSQAGVPVVDGPALFASVESGMASDWSSPAEERSVLYLDRIHPSPLGHTIVAQALARKIRTLSVSRIQALAKQADAPTPTVQIRALKPERVAALATGKDARIEITGRGFHGTSAIDRVFVGGRWMREFQVDDDEHMSIVLPASVTNRPGRHPVVLVTANGTVRSPADVRVLGMPFEVTVIHPGGRAAFEATVHGPPGSKVRLWTAARPRPQPFSTINGDVGLPGNLEGGLPDSPYLLLNWVALDRLAKLDGVVAENGKCVCTGALPPLSSSGPRVLYLQAIVVAKHRSRGVLTDTVKLVLDK